MIMLFETNRRASVTTAYSQCNGHSTSISICEVLGARTAVQVFRKEQGKKKREEACMRLFEHETRWPTCSQFLCHVLNYHGDSRDVLVNVNHIMLKLPLLLHRNTCHSTHHIDCGTLRLAADSLSARIGWYRFGCSKLMGPLGPSQRWTTLLTHIYLTIYKTYFNSYYLLSLIKSKCNQSIQSKQNKMLPSTMLPTNMQVNASFLYIMQILFLAANFTLDYYCIQSFEFLPFWLE